MSKQKGQRLNFVSIQIIFFQKVHTKIDDCIKLLIEEC